MTTTRRSTVAALVLAVVLEALAVRSVVAGPPAPLPQPPKDQILQAIADLQNTVNQLQSSVNSLQQTVNGLKPRTFYLTKGSFLGNQVLSPPAASPACDPGFHFASFTEIVDPSSLKYDTTRGAEPVGGGAPSFTTGWLQPGGGIADCEGWNSDSGSFVGFTGRLISTDPNNPWIVPPQLIECSIALPVWCVQD